MMCFCHVALSSLVSMPVVVADIVVLSPSTHCHQLCIRHCAVLSLQPSVVCKVNCVIRSNLANTDAVLPRGSKWNCANRAAIQSTNACFLAVEGRTQVGSVISWSREKTECDGNRTLQHVYQRRVLQAIHTFRGATSLML